MNLLLVYLEKYFDVKNFITFENTFIPKFFLTKKLITAYLSLKSM